jgi:hypothetical protein
MISYLYHMTYMCITWLVCVSCDLRWHPMIYVGITWRVLLERQYVLDRAAELCSCGILAVIWTWWKCCMDIYFSAQILLVVVGAAHVDLWPRRFRARTCSAQFHDMLGYIGEFAFMMCRTCSSVDSRRGCPIWLYIRPFRSTWSLLSDLPWVYYNIMSILVRE